MATQHSPRKAEAQPRLVTISDSMQAIRIQRTWKKVPPLAHVLQHYIDVGPTKPTVAALGYRESQIPISVLHAPPGNRKL